MGGAFLAVVIAVLAVYLPLLKQIRVQAETARAREAEVLGIREGLERLKKEVFKRHLIAEDEVSTAMEELTRQGNWKGMNFLSISSKPAEKIPDSRVRVLPIEMEAVSSYQALGEFLGLLDELEKSFVTVKSFEINAETKSLPKLNSKLNVQMHFTSE